MNITLAILGSLLIVVAAIRGMKDHNAAIESGEVPKHGDKRIVLDGDTYWTEDYHSFPGWSRVEAFSTLEAAKEDKARWDAIHKASNHKPQVIVK